MSERFEDPSYLDAELRARLRFQGENSAAGFRERLVNLPFRRAELDPDATCVFRLGLVPAGDGRYRLWGEIQANSEAVGFSKLDLWEVTDLDSYGEFRFNGEEKFQFTPLALAPLAELLLEGGPIYCQADEIGDLCFLLSEHFGKLDWILPEGIEIHYELGSFDPLLFLSIRNPSETKKQVRGHLWFRYDAKKEVPAYRIEINSPLALTLTSVVPRCWTIRLRDLEVEEQNANHLKTKGLLKNDLDGTWKVPLLPEVLEALLSEHWEIWAEKIQIRLLNEIGLSLQSAGEWFELRATERKTSRVIPAWQIIHILKRKALFIQLDDGSLGILPQAWINEFRELERLGQLSGDGLRYSRATAFWIGNRIQDLPDFLKKAEKELNSVRSISHEEIPVPQGFQGSLRPYQKQGLLWLNLLYNLKLGGLLADDMGLGKTVQILAHLLSAPGHEKTLLVTPKSVTANWILEAHRFAPDFRALVLRKSHLRDLKDVVSENSLFICSYGFIRARFEDLQRVNWDRLILDEAQLVKNLDTQAAQAVQAIDASHRIALTGTPIENHVREILNLFEILNPGLLPPKVRALLQQETSQEKIKEILKTLAPLYLRRTKSQVLQDLPGKTEETIILEMGNSQALFYEEMRVYYRTQLNLKKTDLDSSRLFFLEGLLRLRQLACHPKLLSEEMTQSNKLEYLLHALKALVESGRKTVIFSQFTAFLSLIEKALEENRIPFARLDGQTQDRQAQIDYFQTNSECPVFLLSLKAGGFGLNLTAADTCFLMDPWWNPAVEQQAIDRIHRIGQIKNITVYRLISKNTVEDKVRELQKIKARQCGYLESTEEDFLNKLGISDFEILFE